MCYDIREVLRLYDEGKYDRHTAKQLILATLKGVNWCDGNSYEAAVSLAFRCAHCLKKTENPKEDLIFTSRFFANTSDIYDYDDLESEDAAFVESLYMEDKFLAPQICHDCLRRLRLEAHDDS